MNFEAVLQKFIVSELLMGNDWGGTISFDTALISSGIVDSLGLIRLINFVEAHFLVAIEDEEVIPDNFETINALSTLIAGKTAPKS